MDDIVQSYSRRAAACVLVLLYVHRQRRNRKCWNIILRFKQNRISVETDLTNVAYNTLIQELRLLVFLCVVIPCRRNVPQIWTILNFVDELKSCTFVFTSVHHFVMCDANHVNRAPVLIGWQSPTHFANRSHVKYEFTNTKKLVIKLARIETSSICRQQFANVFPDCFSTVHTHQVEFANTSLPTLVCRVKAALNYGFPQGR